MNKIDDNSSYKKPNVVHISKLKEGLGLPKPKGGRFAAKSKFEGKEVSIPKSGGVLASLGDKQATRDAAIRLYKEGNTIEQISEILTDEGYKNCGKSTVGKWVKGIEHPSIQES